MYHKNVLHEFLTRIYRKNHTCGFSPREGTAPDVVREELAHEEAELVDRQAPGAARALRLLRPRPVPPRARSRVCLLHLELVVRLGRLLAAVLDLTGYKFAKRTI